MEKRFIIIGFTLLGLVGAYLALHTSASTVGARPVRLVITGPEGQRFIGRYVADGTTNALSAAVPATISLRAKEVMYEFQPADGREEFRVALDVDELHRTSFESYKGQSVRGGWRYSGSGESAW
jgi:hypothetical protein